jgi:hypothetical protein
MKPKRIEHTEMSDIYHYKTHKLIVPKGANPNKVFKQMTTKQVEMRIKELMAIPMKVKKKGK